MKRKTLLSALLVLALLLSMLPTTVFAQSWTITTESPRVDGVRTRSAVESPTLNSGNHASYLDRVTDGPDYVREFYNWMVANSGADGALADPTKASVHNGEYYHKITTIAGSVSFPFTTVDAAVETGTVLAQEALEQEFRLFVEWAGVAWDAFDREHPEVFWLGGQTSYSYLLSASFSLKGTVCTMSYEAQMVIWLQYSGFDIRYTDFRSTAAISAGIQARDAAVNEILAGCPKGSVYDQVVYLNDALTARNAYNSVVATGKGEPAFTAWKCISALVGNVGVAGPVCEGYARAFQVLCDKLSIPCVLVDGPAVASLTSLAESHMWNYVQIDGCWYAIDVTWNDPYVAYAPEKKVSGSECHRWMLLGSDSEVSTGLTFLTSHMAVNRVRNAGLSFTNGPVLEKNAYDPYVNAGYSISGKVSSAGTGDVTVQLWQNGTLVSSVTTGNGTYTFENVAAGDYQLTYLKADHTSITQDLTVSDNTVAQDVKIRLTGDISGDGKLNVGDVARLYGHIKKTSVITDPYILLCMDMTGDGRINVGDTARLYAKIRQK